MGCQSNRLRLGTHTGAKRTVLHVSENGGLGGGGGGGKQKMDHISVQVINLLMGMGWKYTCWMCKCFPHCGSAPLIHYVSVRLGLGARSPKNRPCLKSSAPL